MTLPRNATLKRRKTFKYTLRARNPWLRLLETIFAVTLVGLFSVLVMLFWIALSAAPLVLVALVLHWLGAF